MWSGPRTVSTAMMRSWENRADTVVVDEPLYAHYLVATGIGHPGRDDIIASQSTDWRTVATSLTSEALPPGRTIYYQKHMTHHIVADIDHAALRSLRHAFLIRDPRDLLASYSKVRTEPTLDDLGLRQQVELFEEFGGPVLDSRDLLAAPEASLQALCAALDVPFDPAMLSWPAGRRDTDGVWAPHWYDGVWASTGFSAQRPSANRVPEHLEPLLATCVPYYETLATHRLQIPKES
jgi:hypothetical protein